MIQFITHFTARYSYLDSVRLALEGGCRWIQLRMKNATQKELYRTALIVKQMCSDYGATFIIDDDVHIAHRISADGVHLGKNDMPIAWARDILGPNAIIGGTANTFEDVVSIAQAGGNYIGCGPYRFTKTKERLSPILGIEGYQSIVRRMREHNINLPIVAIGGITAEDLPALKQTGVDGIALSGSVLRANEPECEMKKIIKLWENL